MPNRLSQGTRAYIRRRKAEIRRESANPEAAIEALVRQYPRPTPKEATPRRPRAGTA
jgi:hypothetical protein